MPAWASNSIETSWHFTTQDVKNFDIGKVVIHAESEGNQKEIHAFLRINATPKQMLDIITDYQTLPEFMPHLEVIEVLRQGDDDAVVNYMLALPFGVHKRYRLHLQYDVTAHSSRMSWQKVEWQGLTAEETIKDSKGFWLFKAEGKHKTLLHYYTETDPGYVPFGLGWIVEYLTEKTVVDLLKNTKKRAEKLWGKQ